MSLKPRTAAFAAVLALALALWFGTGLSRLLSWESLVRHQAALDGFVAQHGVLAPVAFTAAFAAVVILSVPGSAVINVAAGILFGATLGGSLTLLGSTFGCLIIFLIARSALGHYLAGARSPRVLAVAETLRADAFYCVLFVRLALVPTGLINLAAAFCRLRLWPFIAATVLGTIPGAFALAALGAGMDSMIRAQEAAYERCIETGAKVCHLDTTGLVTPQVMIALASLSLLALIPPVVKHLRGRGRSVAGNLS